MKCGFNCVPMVFGLFKNKNGKTEPDGGESPADGKGKKVKKIDSLITGIVIGGAIGSVLGLTLSPKSGKENRDFVKKKSSETWQKSKLLLGEVLNREEKKKGFWHKLHGFFIKKKHGGD